MIGAMIRAGILLVLAAGPSAAEGLFSAPAGCTVFATVQGADCSVKQLLECEGQPGVTSVTLSAYPGSDFISFVDPEARWMMIHNAYYGTTQTLVEPEADPSLLSDLLGTGRNAYDFTMQSQDGTVTRYVGKEALTGAQIEVNGVVLLETANQMETFAADGSWQWSMISREYVSPDWGTFVGGPVTWTAPLDGEFQTDSTPVEIALPGDAGFLATVPVFGCAG